MTRSHAPIDRRQVLLGTAVLAGSGLVPTAAAWAQAAGLAALSGDKFELVVDHLPVNITGKRRTAVAINGSTPAPLLRMREGDTVTIKVVNRLDEPTSIHWHGLRLPPEMDGTPGLSFAGIPARSEFTYRFPVRQHGTYWYHSHSGAQEPLGMFGPIIIEPKSGEAHAHDREHVIMLSDWSDENGRGTHSVSKQIEGMSPTTTHFSMSPEFGVGCANRTRNNPRILPMPIAKRRSAIGGAQSYDST